jgi:lactoylglutathione lyase
MVVSAFRHVGHCVTDLERSKRFYCDALGFRPKYEVRPSDDSVAPLLSLTPPLSTTASYLVRDGLVLELLYFAADGQTRPFRARTMNEPGLTHISFAVDDLDRVCERVRACGGVVIDATHVGDYVFVRDPDGQLLELIAMSHLAALRAELRAAVSALRTKTTLAIARAKRSVRGG